MENKNTPKPEEIKQKVDQTSQAAEEQAQKVIQEMESIEPPRTKRINTAWMWIILVLVCALVIVWIMPARCTTDNSKVPNETIATVLEQGDTAGAPHTMTAAEAEAAAKAQEAAVAEDNVDAEVIAAGGTAGEGGVTPANAAVVNSNKEVSASANASLSGDVDDLAHRVLKGEFGNNPSRRNALGANYAAVQARVNQLLK